MGKPAPPRASAPLPASGAVRPAAPRVGAGAADADDAGLPIAAGNIVAGKYRLERPLSRGAMGSVWVATHLALDTHVAIKFMVADADADARASSPSLEGAAAAGGSSDVVPPSSRSVETRSRFEREAKAAAQIRSANVVQILDYGVDRETQYIVMELLRGEDLGARLGRVKRLPIHEVSHLVVAVARALQRAHDAGLVHRDLKPGNIFLAKEGEEEVPKVLDFGVAKRTSDRQIGEGTLEGTLVGTPSYMSPEQAMGRSAVDHRADLWSLGVIIYRALTGVRPFESKSLLETVVQICSETPRPPSQLEPGLPPAIDAFMERALERDVTLRFQSAKEMARELTRIAPPKARSLPPAASAAHAAPKANDVDIPIHVTSSPDDPTVQQGSIPGDVAAAAAAAARAAPDEPTSEASLVAAPAAADAAVGSENGSQRRRLFTVFVGLAAIGLLAATVALVRRGRIERPAQGASTTATATESAAAPASAETATGTAATAAAPPTTATASATASAAEAASASASATAEAASADIELTAPESSATASAATEAPSAEPQTKPPVRTTPTHGQATKSVDCSTPYYWDSSGTKHVKPQCL
jgi:serine/threonine protein kinase